MLYFNLYTFLPWSLSLLEIRRCHYLLAESNPAEDHTSAPVFIYGIDTDYICKLPLSLDSNFSIIPYSVFSIIQFSSGFVIDSKTSTRIRSHEL